MIDDFEEVDPYDEFGADEFDDVADFASYGPPARGKKKTRRDATAKWVRIGLIIFAIAVCVRTVGFGASVIAQLMAQTGRTTSSAETLLMLFKTDMWLRVVAMAAMVVAYGFFVSGRDREGSQGWAIASVVLGAIATGAFFIMYVMPVLEDDESVRALIQLALMQVGLGSTTSTLWESVFQGWVLTALYLSHLFTAMFFYRTWFHSDKVLPGRASMTMVCLMANAGAVLLRGILIIFVMKVVLPAAIESREPPSEIWSYLEKGLHWIGLIAFLVFLIMAIRVAFGAISESR